MINDQLQPQDKLQSQRKFAQEHPEIGSYSAFSKKSQLFSLKKCMEFSVRDYSIIFCIAMVMLILASFNIFSLPVFFLGLFTGRIYGGGGGFFDFIVFLPTLIWALCITFLPVVLVLHFFLNRNLKRMLQKLETSSTQQNGGQK
ncbi:hypothetical protein [Bartonella refiksaydamii]|uniref:hypothetical protein n=1 Tax=Bartonella refiksaydamii TaxID=2654951 RepID=UPI0012EBEC05|nr:hypothetical protein [Bartonella refiksaydamii]